jgi:LemA protein
MASSDDALDRYLKKLMELKFNRQEKRYSEEDLRQIALDSGLSEKEWEQAQQRALSQKKRGQLHIEHTNWTDALEELEAASALLPNDAEAHVLTAKAYLNRATIERREEDLLQADYHLDEALQIDEKYEEAYALKKQLATRRQLLHTNTTQHSNNRKLILGMVLGGIALIVIIWYFSTYNAMVAAEEQTVEAWAQVENVYQRREDLIPNLVETVRAAADFEQETLQEVIAARNQAQASQVDPTNLNPAALRRFEESQALLGSTLSRLIAVAEDYPQLSATENFRDLQAQLEGTENRIAVERRRFNQAVQAYNARSRKFPNNLLGFDTKAYFSATAGAEEAPEVKFD